MRQTLQYFLVDVFTKTRFGGNPLAVFPDADGLSKEVMQQIAKELNLSETTFIQRPRSNKSDCTVRIFTPATELPMAGHPTVGTAFVLLNNKLIIPKGNDHFMFDEGIGSVRVNYQRGDDGHTKIVMEQPLPVFGSTYADIGKIAEMLSVNTAAIDENLPVQVVSSGVPVVIVPINSLAAIRQAKVRVDLLERYLGTFESQVLFLFTRETIEKASTVHSRFFAHQFGIPEDPATGSASGPLGAYLVKYGLSDGKNIISEQGIEMGRPSTLYIDIETTHDHGITSVQVGGYCVSVGSGNMILD